MNAETVCKWPNEFPSDPDFQKSVDNLFNFLIARLPLSKENGVSVPGLVSRNYTIDLGGGQKVISVEHKYYETRGQHNIRIQLFKKLAEDKNLIKKAAYHDLSWIFFKIYSHPDEKEHRYTTCVTSERLFPSGLTIYTTNLLIGHPQELIMKQIISEINSTILPAGNF